MSPRDRDAPFAYVHGTIADPGARTASAAWPGHVRPATRRHRRAPKPGDSDDVLIRRGTLWQLLGLTAGDTALQAEARTLAEGYLTRAVVVPPSFVAPVLQVAAAGGDAALYDRYVAAAKAAIARRTGSAGGFDALASLRARRRWPTAPWRSRCHRSCAPGARRYCWGNC